MITRLNSLGFNELVAEYTVTGSAATAITFDGLDINADGGYTIVAEFIRENSGSNSAVNLFFNNDTTVTNYSTRYINSASTSLVTGSNSNSECANISGTVGQITYAVIDLMRCGNYGVYNSNISRNNTTEANINFCKHSISQTNINRLDFVSTTSNTIGIGSKIKIYRWKQGIHTLNSLAQGRLVWSHEVTGSAVSSVTATGLDILRDGGYKIVVGLVSAASSVIAINLSVNNDGLAIPGVQIYSAGTSNATDTIPALTISQASATSGQISFSTCDLSLVNGYVCGNSNIMLYNTTEARIRWNKKSTTDTNVTSIQFTAASGTPIGIGSKFYIFRNN